MPRPPIDESLAGRLIGSFFRFIRTPWHMVPAPGLSRTETGVLLTIRRAQTHGLPCRVSDLSKRMQVSSPTMTQHVANLEKRGFVRKEQDQKDKRALNLFLTEQGLEMLEQHRAAMDENINELIALLGEKDAEQLVSLLTRTSEFFAEKEKSYEEW